MRAHPTALAWIDPEISTAPDWEAAQIARLARHLGYALTWPVVTRTVPLIDQIRSADIDALVLPAPNHLDALTLNLAMHLVDVETVCPRMSFARWRAIDVGARDARPAPR
ncbi:hypothetical protein NONO_c70100 [Nocardia nova SH22a]|uniref:Uncharacterized protein n=2 Tax=Nocardia nova TaxID=37330 RepID=W5TX30_9NOCA|nr:hypothetical protein [Nocardia nova]AHH21771.1 hypothetical protein NONO_c70100 [Nocardia nova SH22a]